MKEIVALAAGTAVVVAGAATGAVVFTAISTPPFSSILTTTEPPVPGIVT
jgi:hypothetical protein